MLLSHLAFSLFANCQEWDDSSYTSELKIAQVVIDAQNVFDPALEDENRTFHQVANKLRIQTKEHVIKRDLLFTIGDNYNPKLLEETERILRSRPYIKDAMISPISSYLRPSS